jgi:ABC-type antimicrobial peptide transport system permease subunit
MTLASLVRRSLAYYRLTNLAVILGVATAVTVLAGALLVGDSVRGSLRDLVLQRLGRTDIAVVSTEFFRERLAIDLHADPAFENDFDDVCPIVAVPGIVGDQQSGRRSARVQVYGVDHRFWILNGIARAAPLERDEALLSEPLAREIGAGEGSTVIVRVQRPSDIPLESLHGRKEDIGRSIRLTVKHVLSARELGEFSLQPRQGDVRAAFVALPRLQDDLEVVGRVNTLLLAGRGGVAPDLKVGPTAGPPTLETRAIELLRRRAALEDVGLKTRVLEARQLVSLETQGTLIDAPREEAAMAAARELRLPATPVMTYLVNGIKTATHVIPYSLVTATELTAFVPDLKSDDSGLPPIVLNEWAARDLAVKPGDRVALDYFVWEDPGRLTSRTSAFRVAAVVPIAGAAADRDFAPAYPGITESDTLRDWDPPFPIDLRRIRPVDEDYWRQYRTTPKAFVPEEFGRASWSSRYGSLTSIRFAPPPGTPPAAAAEQFAARLRAGIDPIALGLTVRPVRAEGLAASRGATDFGEYFAYFSFFLVVSAVLLAALFFKLGVEQRVREVGLLRAVGFTTPAVTRLFAAEAAALSGIGSAIGLLGAIAYAALMITGLRTWWVGAVGTTAITLHVSGVSLLAGVGGGVVAALVCSWWTLRGLARVSERRLLAGEIGIEKLRIEKSEFRIRILNSHFLIRNFATVAFLLVAVLLLIGASFGWIGRTGAFFGAGASLLLSALFAIAFVMRRPTRTPIAGRGWRPVARLGLRNASYRPARSVLAIAVIASATFILISVGAFRRDNRVDMSDPHSGTGGYPLIVETVMPFVHDPNSPEGRSELGVPSDTTIAIEPFRVRPGDDASCLNLYEPKQPKIVGVRRGFTAEGRFEFAGSLKGAERENPWLLLEREQDDGAIPVIADANSMTYVLHKSLGDEIAIDRGGAPEHEIRLRLVAALSDSIFQSELLMSEANFLKLFPEDEGYRLLLVNAPPDRVQSVAAGIEDRLSDAGADAVATADRLAEFHRVENTYLATFQTLGGLGLLVGTIGLAAVLLRNVLERRRELALLGAVGYGRGRLFTIVIAESTLLLVCGLAVGAVSALLAIMPAAADHGGRLPAGAGAALMVFGVLATGLVSSIVAARAALQARLLDALRNE